MQDPGLVAHYSFNEGAGTLLHDTSGNGNNGQIVGAQWIERRNGYCLEFNGIDNYVDCGAGPSLDLRDAITLEAWVLLDAGLGEAGIAGKHYESYFLSYYADGKCYWYINQSGIANNVGTLVLPGSWHHLATTFDGVTLSVYLDGKLVVAKPSKSSPGVNPGMGVGSTRAELQGWRVDLDRKTAQCGRSRSFRQALPRADASEAPRFLEYVTAIVEKARAAKVPPADSEIQVKGEALRPAR